MNDLDVLEYNILVRFQQAQDVIVRKDETCLIEHTEVGDPKCVLTLS